MKIKTERKQTIKALLDKLAWLKSKQNVDRMEDKGIEKSGIVEDAVGMCLDFAEEEGHNIMCILANVLVHKAMQIGTREEDSKDLYQLFVLANMLAKKQFKASKKSK